jgi:hypothetical protein
MNSTVTAARACATEDTFVRWAQRHFSAVHYRRAASSGRNICEPIQTRSVEMKVRASRWD